MARFEDTFPPYHPFGSRLLGLRSPQLTGTDVAVLQAVYNMMLQAMHPAQGPMGDAVELDGIFGPKTTHAVINIQSYFALPTDGIAGQDTYFVYGHGTGRHTGYGGPAFGSRALAPGASGGDVRVLQNRLSCFRYAKSLAAPSDGLFGPRTSAALEEFKADAALYGQEGLLHNPRVGQGAFDGLWIYSFAGGRTMEAGRNGFDVVFLQRFLKNHGLYTGSIDGYYGTATRSAVKDFQAASGISPDGAAGAQTFFQIGLHNDAPAPRPLSATTF